MRNRLLLLLLLPITLPAQDLRVVAGEAPGTELVSFEALTRAPRVELRWATMSEGNDLHFVVERSADQLTWDPVAELPAVGNTTKYLTYEAWDVSPLPGISYYRLLGLHEASAYIISEPFSVRSDARADLLTIAEGSTGRFTVKASGGDLSEVQLINNRGQFVTIPLEYQPDQVFINAELLPAGTYFLCALVGGVPVMRPLYIGAFTTGG